MHYSLKADELSLAHDEIKKNEKELRNILMVAEFLFENREEMPQRMQ